MVIILNYSEIGWGDIDWIDLTQDRGQWRAIAYMIMSFLFP
jgi:hypothetical protein